MIKLNKKLILAVVVVVLAALTIYTVYPRAREDVSQENIRLMSPRFSKDIAYNHIVELSSEKYTGRKPGTEGNYKAAEYIAEQFRQYGLTPAGDGGTYFQSFKMQTIIYNDDITLKVVDKSNNLVESFAYRYDYVDVNDKEDVKFDIEAPFEIYSRGNNISQLNNSNTILVSDGKGGFAFNELDKVPLLLYTRPKGRDTTPMYIKSGVLPGQTYGVNSLFITPEVFLKLESYKEQGYHIKASADISYPIVEVPNVVAMYKAEKETNETLIICGHFDHLGEDPDGGINWGALDNASGTAVMLELARTVSASEVKLPFNIVFIAFNGEESGLLGAYHYVNNMSHDKKNLKVINLDMVGYHQPERLELGTLSKNSGNLTNQLADISKKVGVEVDVKNGSGGSDHVPFAEAGVDAIMFIHFAQDCFDRFYHNPMDDINIIDKDKLEEVGKIIIQYIIDRANGELQGKAGEMPVFLM